MITVYVIKGDNGYLSFTPEDRFYVDYAPACADVSSTRELAESKLYTMKMFPEVINPKIKVWQIEEKDLDETK